MEVRYCEVDQVQVGDRLRHLDLDKVAALAESMAAIGLQQPISVWSDSMETLDLVAGLHRLEAARKLGWEDIDCIYVDLDDLDRQLWEIDENLMRADLSPAEMAEHTAKRAKVVKQKAALILSQVEKQSVGHPDEGQGEFDEQTAKATGKSKSTVRRDKARGEAIPADVLGKIQGTELDKGTYLDKLRKLPREEQRDKVVVDLAAGSERKKGKSRRTSVEVQLDDFDHAIRVITNTCDLARKIDVPNLDSKRRSSAVTALRNAGKHIQESIEIIQHSDEENEPARRKASRPARWSDAASRAVTALEEMQEMQSEYQDWLETLPDNLQESAVAEKLASVTEIDFDSAIETVSEAEEADLPLGFGRD